MERAELKERIDEFRHVELPRLRKLDAYFSGKHRILFEKKDPGKPDNRLVNNFCKAITDSTVGYFMGIPVSYGSDDQETLAEALRLCAASDEPFVNSALAKDMSVYGRACELLWCDGDGDVRFAPVSPETAFPVYSEDVCETLVGAVRMFKRRDGSVFVQYMDRSGIYDFTDSPDGLHPIGEREHYFGAVPANFYRNNRDMTGDFEPVLTLVDAYNRLQSECVNDFELFADSYLAISGMGGTTAEDMKKVREERVLLLDDGGEAKWLTKTTNDVYIENLKTRIAKDIYRFSGTADVSEVDSGGSVPSGVAMKYRLFCFENRVSATEQYFRRGLMRRFAVIGGLYRRLGKSFKWQSIKPTFTRNIPGGFESAAELARSLDGLVSKRTIIEMLPFVENPDAEIARMKEDESGVK